MYAHVIDTNTLLAVFYSTAKAGVGINKGK
jgi:hypothetical protein